MKVDNIFGLNCNILFDEWEARMELVFFKTDAPFDHAQRVLDMLRTMGFAFEALSITCINVGRYAVQLRYSPQGTLSAQTFLQRLTKLAGLEICEAAADPADNSPIFAQDQALDDANWRRDADAFFLMR